MANFSYDYKSNKTISGTSGWDVLTLTTRDVNGLAYFGDAYFEGNDLILVSAQDPSISLRVVNQLTTGNIEQITYFAADGAYATYSLRIGSIDTDMSSAEVAYDIFGTNADDSVYVGELHSEASGSGGNDVLLGGAGNNYLVGGRDNDKLFGGDGDDWLYGDEFRDAFALIYNSSGDDYLNGGRGNDHLFGSAGSDTLIGGSGNDSLNGGSGNDVLDDGAGTDYIDGGEGIDTFQRNLSSDYADYAFTAVVDLAAGKFYALGYENDFDTLVSIENVTMLGNFHDRIYGASDNNTLSGNNGNDTLYGNSGNDKLYGGNNNDKLFGGSGNDSLQGDAGKDTLTGGSGADSFIFRSVSESATGATTADVITDFVGGTDKINLSAIDASTKLSGNNDFIFNGTTKFGTSNQGEIYYNKFNNSGTANDYTMVWIDNDGDAGVEMAIRLTGLHNLTASDFVL